jgi:SMI1-KNR4 cell-wall
MNKNQQRFKMETQPGGKLFGLEIPTAAEIEKMNISFPKLSPEYQWFVENIGVGVTETDTLEICLPYNLREDHYRLSEKAAGEFIVLPDCDGIPKDVLVVAPSGASWLYCLKEHSDSTVYCFDFSNRQLTIDCENFFKFVELCVDMNSFQ